MEASLRVGLVFLLLLCFFTALPSCCCSAPTLVHSLPGFDGALPFRLHTGYVSVDEENGAELFYYFVESEGEPGRDPVILWLPGGDHCSALSPLLFDRGPLRFILEPYDDYNDNGTVPRLRYHPYSWTKVASVLFVDSPVGAGFSYSRNAKGYDVGEVSTALHLKMFLTKWFIEHPGYLTNPFYIGADSLGGRIAPFLAQKISEDIEAGLSPLINLKGYLVGNPATVESSSEESRVPFLHGMGIISDQLYETINEQCQAGDYVNSKNVLCGQAMDKFNRLLDDISMTHILHKKCNFVAPQPNGRITERKILKEETRVLKRPPPRPPIDCHNNYGNYLSYFWANSNITREALGIKKGSKDEWVICHHGDLPYSLDMKSSIKYHHNMTTKGYRVLVYSGDHDAMVPFLGTQSWVRSLNFPIVDEWRAWHLDGQSAGFTITYTNNLTFATIKGSGHSAPEFQPERCLAMLSRWIFGKPI